MVRCQRLSVLLLMWTPNYLSLGSMPSTYLLASIIPMRSSHASLCTASCMQAGVSYQAYSDLLSYISSLYRAIKREAP